MKSIILIIALFLVLPASACTDCCPNPVINNNVTVSNILSQIQWMTQQQSQQQEQTVNVASGTQTSWIDNQVSLVKAMSGQDPYGVEQESQTYSRLLYPNEVIPFPVKPGQNCTVLSGLPIAFYTINSGNGTYDLMVQTLTATPSYDPVYHRMEFGQVPVVNKIDYWTMKARIQATSESDFCVVDNRAPFNGYTTIEVTIK